MEFPMHFAQPASGHVRINLRRRDARVTKQLLNHTQVRAMLQQVRGETVPQHVGRDVARNAGQPHAPLDPQPERHGRERRTAPGQEHIAWRTPGNQFRAPRFQMTLQRRDRFAANRDDAFFVSFADDIDESGVQMKLFETHAPQLGQSQ